MKINKSKLKDLLKEVVIELISEGQVQIKQSLVNELKISNSNLSDNNVSKNKIIASKTVQKKLIKKVNEQAKPVLKSTTGNPLLDQYINNAPREEDSIQMPTSNVPKQDYSEFIQDL